MPILRTDVNENLTTFVVSGQVTFGEAMVTLQAFYSENPASYVLWDFRQGTMYRLPYDKIKIIVDYIVPLAYKRAGGKTALVTATEVDFGVARIFDTFAEINQLPFAVRVIGNYDEAMAWLEGET